VLGSGLTLCEAVNPGGVSLGVSRADCRLGHLSGGSARGCRSAIVTPRGRDGRSRHRRDARRAGPSRWMLPRSCKRITDRGCGGSARGSAISRLPHAAFLCAVMANDAQRGIALSMVVHFAAATNANGFACFQGCAETGNRAKQDVLKTALCIDRARSIHKLIPVPRPCRKFPSGILRRRARQAGAELKAARGV
jgi:hypothetical protein